MTEKVDLSAITVLVLGNLSDHAAARIARIGGTLNMVRLEKGDPALVTPQLAKSVRGIAAFGGINAAFIDALPNLEIVASFGVGYDSVNAAAMPGNAA